MGSGMYSNVGMKLSQGKDMERYARMVMDCLFPDPGFCGVMTILLEEFRGCDWSRKNGKIDPEELFHLLNTLFGPTYVYTEDGQYTTIADYYQREERIYDPIRMVERYAYQVVDFGGFGEFEVEWEALRQELQEKGLYEPLTRAMLEMGYQLDENFDCIDELSETYEDDPAWIFGEFDCQPGDEHWDLTQQVYEILSKYVSGEESGDVNEQRDTPLELEAVSQETIDTLIQIAIEKGYTELVALILEKTKYSKL